MDPDDRAVSPDEAFGLLGDETRMEMLRAVWGSPAETVSFSELRASVGNPDSGRFNYHLNELEGHLLAKEREGYRLTQAGREVVRAVLAGTLTRRPETDPVRIDGRCTACDGTLVARYDERYVVECGDCGERIMWNEFPPAGLDGRSPTEVATAFDRWTRSRFRLAMEGICPNCAATMEAGVVDSGDDGIATEHRCLNCRYEARVPLLGHVLYRPAVVSFLHEEGVDVTARPYWQARSLADDAGGEVVSEEPWRAEITIETDARSLALTLDEDLAVVDAERRSG